MTEELHFWNVKVTGMNNGGTIQPSEKLVRISKKNNFLINIFTKMTDWRSSLFYFFLNAKIKLLRSLLRIFLIKIMLLN